MLALVAGRNRKGRFVKVLLREVHAQALHTEPAVAHHISLGGQDAVGEDGFEAVMVLRSRSIVIEWLGGIVQLLRGCIEQAFLFVVDGDGVENDLADGVAVAVFDETDVESARVVARVGVGCSQKGVVGSVEGTGDLDVVGVGAGVEQTIDDGHLLVIGKDVDIV